MKKHYDGLMNGLTGEVVVEKSSAEVLHGMMLEFVQAQIGHITEQEERSRRVWMELASKISGFTNRELLDLYTAVTRQKNNNIMVLLENFKTEEKQSLLDPSVERGDGLATFYDSLDAGERQKLELLYQALKTGE